MTPLLLRSWILRSWALLLITLGLGGCASGPSVQEYLMTQPKADALPDQGKSHVTQLSSVQIPTYLSGSAMVLVDEQGQVYRARQHLWAEPLSNQLTRLAWQRLQQRLPQWTWLPPEAPYPKPAARLSLTISRFEADFHGDSRIEGQWRWVSATGDQIYCGTLTGRSPLTTSGYAGMAQALADNWSQVVIDTLAKTLVSETPPQCH